MPVAAFGMKLSGNGRRGSDSQELFVLMVAPDHRTANPCCWVGGGTMPFMRRYSTICP